jgi:lipopolysaccharide transport system ATP-binding protein
MRRHEITRKMDEIINFSGVERYIDTPVKRYSSGMYVRLAFAVAAHLESEILIIDEVLAVGDAEFQKKCLGKMGDISKGEGRTVLFVSHDLSAVSILTKKSLFLENGNLIEFDITKKVIQTYSNNLSSGMVYTPIINETVPSVSKVEIITSEGGLMQGCGEELKVEFEIFMPKRILGMALSIQIINHLNQAVTYNWIFDKDTPFCRNKGINSIVLHYPNIKLYKGNYHLRIHLAETITKQKFQQFDCLPFEVEMINKISPEWGWQENVCKYIEESRWEMN